MSAKTDHRKTLFRSVIDWVIVVSALLTLVFSFAAPHWLSGPACSEDFILGGTPEKAASIFYNFSSPFIALAAALLVYQAFREQSWTTQLLEIEMNNKEKYRTDDEVERNKEQKRQKEIEDEEAKRRQLAHILEGLNAFHSEYRLPLMQEMSKESSNNDVIKDFLLRAYGERLVGILRDLKTNQSIIENSGHFGWVIYFVVHNVELYRTTLNQWHKENDDYLKQIGNLIAEPNELYKLYKRITDASMAQYPNVV